MTFRQKFARFVICFALSISVFFCSYDRAFADELDPADEIGFEVDVDTIRPVLVYPIRLGSNGYGESLLDSNFTLLLKPGYIYNGQIVVRFSLEYEPANITGFNMGWYDINCRSSLADVGVSYNYFKRNGDVWTFDLYLTFNGLYVESELPITVSVTMLCRIFGEISSSTTKQIGNMTLSPSADFSSRNWTATLPTEYNEGGIITEQGALDREQQQQIANQQSQQSAQQHEDLKEGFTDNTYNNNVSNAGSQVDSYINLEHNLLEQQNQQMSDYADTAFNLNTLSPYINAIALTSTFFTWIWNGFGEMNVVFVIVLAIGVACLILGIRKRG